MVVIHKREQGLVYHEKGALSDFTSFAAHSNDSGGAGRNSVDNCTVSPFSSLSLLQIPSAV